MKFCKFCKGIIVKRGSKFMCISCSLKYDDFVIDSTELFHSSSTDIPIINEKDSEVLPLTEHICSKCNHNEAYFWHGNYIGDEAETLFYRCKKCGYTTQQGGQRGGR